MTDLNDRPSDKYILLLILNLVVLKAFVNNFFILKQYVISSFQL